MNDVAQPVLECRALRKHYREGPRELVVLDGVELNVARGERVAIVGQSGSGKSTLLNIIGMLETMSGGSYRLQGEEVGGLDDAGSLVHRIAGAGHRGGKNLPNCGFVIDDQHVHGSDPVSGGGPLLRSERQLDGDHGPAHEVGELLGNGQAQPGTPVLPRG